MAETRNLKNVFKDLSVDKILTIVSITLSAIAIILSIIAISKTPSNGCVSCFPMKGQIWDSTTNATEPNPWGKSFGKKGQRKNQNGPSNNNNTNEDPGNANNNNHNNIPRFDRFRQNNS